MKMKLIAAAVGLCSVLASGAALAVNEICDSVTGVGGSGECQVTKLHTLTSGTPYSVDRALHVIGPLGVLRVINGGTMNLNVDGNVAGGAPLDGLVMDGGKIIADVAGTAAVGGTLNIVVASGNVLLHAPASISADNTAGGGCGSGAGGVVNLTANGKLANVVIDFGAEVTANGSTCSAGAVNIAATSQGTIAIAGSVLAESSRSGSGQGPNGNLGGTQQPGGGPITINATCGLQVNDTGVVSSKGADSGADIVQMRAGCDMLIEGLVQSTGAGHVAPGNPPNSCSDIIPRPGSVRRNPITRIGKPLNSDGCIELDVGNSLTINLGGTHKGELNADTGHSPGGSTGTSWIDIFSRGDISIRDIALLRFAVHANGNANTDDGGTVTLKTLGTGPKATPGNIFVFGRAIQANGGSHGKGGVIDVESTLGSLFTDGAFEAKTGIAATDIGGRISVLAQKNIISSIASVLNLTGGTPPNGIELVQSCFTIDPITTIPGILANLIPGVCPPPVAVPAYALPLPGCPGGDSCGSDLCICKEGFHVEIGSGFCIPD